MIVNRVGAGACPSLVTSQQQMLVGATSVTVDGQPLAAGRVVTATNQTGSIVGCVVTAAAGQFRLPVNGNDGTTTTAGYPVAQDPLALQIDGAAVPSSAITITASSASPGPTQLIFVSGSQASYLLVTIAAPALLTATPTQTAPTTASATPTTGVPSVPTPAATVAPTDVPGPVGGPVGPVATDVVAVPTEATPGVASSTPVATTVPRSVTPQTSPQYPLSSPTAVAPGVATSTPSSRDVATVSPQSTSVPVAAPALSQATVPPAGGATTLSAGDAGAVTVAISPSVMAELRRTFPALSGVAVQVDGAPTPENPAAAGALGGGVVVPVSRPIDVKVTLPGTGPTAQGGAFTPDATSTPVVDLTLPVLPSPPGTSSNGTFTWLQAIYANDGSFLGYIRPAADFDPSTGLVTLHVALASLQGTLFLPATIVPAWVQSFADDLHIYSGPTDPAEDWGSAGPQFTTYVVVAPQVANRLYVYNPITRNYGWIDVNGVGPVPEPAQ